MVVNSARVVGAALVLLSAVARTADVDPASPAAPPTVEPEIVQWQFSYQGPLVTARGVVSTAAMPEPDGSYRILSITGKRNGKRIVELMPAGEFVTTRTFLYSDNRLLPASPFIGEGGFSYRTSDAKYFNVCHAGEDGTCGRKGYREYDGKRGGRSIQLVLKRVHEEAPAATPPPATAARNSSDGG
jgi:hypothetical protein